MHKSFNLSDLLNLSLSPLLLNFDPICLSTYYPWQMQNMLELGVFGAADVDQHVPHAAGTNPPAGALPTGPTGNQDDTHATDTSTPGGGDAPAGEGGNTPLVNTIITVMGQVDEQMEKMERKRREKELRREQREKKRACLKKTGYIGNILFAAVVGIVALFFGIYGLYHFPKPANDLALESLIAAEWSNYYNWVWTICPAERARNMTVLECDEAQNYTVPPPKRPDNFNSQQTLGYKLARRLVPHINGSYEFELLISKTDETCGLKDDIRNITTCSQYSPWSIPLQEPFSSAHDLRRRSFDFSLTFPLPSPKLRSPINRPNVPSKFLFWFIALNMCIVWFVSSIKQFYLFLAYLICYDLERFLVNRIMNLAIWIAQDTFLESCLATHGLDESLNSAVCTHILGLASNLDISDQAKVWAIWRGFFFGRIQEANLDGATLKGLLVDLSLFEIPHILGICFLMVALLAWRHALVLCTNAARQELATRVDEEQPLIDLSEG